MVQKIIDGRLSVYDEDLTIDNLAIFTSQVFACHFPRGIDSRPSFISSFLNEYKGRFDVVKVIEAAVETYPELMGKKIS